MKNDCEVCGRPDSETPMCYRGTGRCSEACQKLKPKVAVSIKSEEDA